MRSLRVVIDKYITEPERLQFLATLVRTAEAVSVTESIMLCRDAKDDKFLELVVSGQATHIITGDDDLLSLHPFRGVAIVSPRDFVLAVHQV